MAVREPRFVVVAVMGDRALKTGDTGHPPGCEAVVLDSANAYRQVAAFASDQRMGPGHGRNARLGIEAAVAAARHEADRLNEWDASLPRPAPPEGEG